MAGNVVALGNFSIPSAEPVAAIVEMLEASLVKAMDGKIIGIAIVTVERDPLAFEHDFHAEQSSRHTLAAGVLSMTHALGRELNE